jgi:hypothetical protein
MLHVQKSEGTKENCHTSMVCSQCIQQRLGGGGLENAAQTTKLVSKEQSNSCISKKKLRW